MCKDCQVLRLIMLKQSEAFGRRYFAPRDNKKTNGYKLTTIGK